MTTARTIPHTTNPAYGFYGTIATHAPANKLWDLAFRRIEAVTKGQPEDIAAFLDSRYGRHFADDVVSRLMDGLDEETALEATVTRWYGLKLGARLAYETGMPSKMSYLQGMVAAMARHRMAE